MIQDQDHGLSNQAPDRRIPSEMRMELRFLKQYLKNRATARRDESQRLVDPHLHLIIGRNREKRVIAASDCEYNHSHTKRPTGTRIHFYISSASGAKCSNRFCTNHLSQKATWHQHSLIIDGDALNSTNESPEPFIRRVSEMHEPNRSRPCIGNGFSRTLGRACESKFFIHMEGRTSSRPSLPFVALYDGFGSAVNCYALA